MMWIVLLYLANIFCQENKKKVMHKEFKRIDKKDIWFDKYWKFWINNDFLLHKNFIQVW